VRYTVWSRGRLIGDTDLGYIRIINKARSGSFHPNAEGERVMPVIASVLPAMRAYLHRDAVDALGDPIVQPALQGSKLFADLAEAFENLRSLDLELRREDGSVVPTSDIGIQDTQQLLEFAALDDGGVEAANGDADADHFEATERYPQLGYGGMDDAEPSEQALGERVNDLCSAWTPDDLQEPQFPRYQIHVLLLHDDAIA
jgi:hypothetical protein